MKSSGIVGRQETPGGGVAVNSWPQSGVFASSILPHLRWLILLIFVAGYLLTAGKFQSAQGQYAVYSLISMAACALLLVRLDRYGKESVAAWLALIVFLVTQYVRFYSLVIDPSFLRIMLSEGGWQALRSEEALIDGFRLATIAFCDLLPDRFYSFSLDAWEQTAEQRRSTGAS